VLKPGMTFSNEPTICIYGEFGVRLEDHMVITETGRPLVYPAGPFGRRSLRPGEVRTQIALGLPRPRRAAQRCGGWPKARMKARRNPLRIAKAGGLRERVRSPRWRMHARPRHLDPQALHRLDGVVPVSAMKARAKCRELMPACSARSSTVSGASRCSRRQVTAVRSARSVAFNSNSEENWRLAAAAAVIEHELARGLCAISSPKSSAAIAQRQIDAAVIPAELRCAVADEDLVGLPLHPGWPRESAGRPNA